MLNLENFMKLLEDAMPSSDGMSLNEKIMSKKAARRRKKKLAAAKKAAEEAKKQEIEQTEEEEEKEEGTGTALIVYEEPKNEEDYEQISEEFTKIVNTLDQAMSKHKQEIEQAMGMWKQAGQDNPCPEEAWNILDSSIKNLQNVIQNTITPEFVDKLAQPELQILDRYLTGVNGYLEKASQEVLAAKPNLVEADFQAPAVVQDGEITTTTGTALAPTTGTSLTTTDTVDTTPLEDDKQDKDKRTKKKLVSYKRFWDNFKTLSDSFDALCSGIKVIGEAIKKGAKALGNLALQPISFLNDKLFAFLTSPLAKDIVKTFMYANPFTKMLFDGDFGKIGIKNPLDTIHDKLNKVTHSLGNKAKDPTKEEPNNYTSRKLPKSLDDKTLKQLKKEYYSNKAMVDLINVSYNHPDVKIQDKADLQKFTTSIPRLIKTKNVEGLKSKLKSLVKTCNKICDYMDWNKPSDWQNLITKYLKAKGNTKKEQDKIDAKNKPKKNAEKKEKIDDDTIDQIVDKLAKKLGKQEAFEEKITKLEKLLEEAEGDK